MGLILDGTTGISASGNIYAGNLIVTGDFVPTNVSTVGNVQGLNLATTGNVSAVGNVTGSNFIASGILLGGGNASVGGNVTVGALFTGGAISAAGNIKTASNLLTPNVASSTNLNLGTTTTPNLVVLTNSNLSVFGGISAYGAIVTEISFRANGTASVSGNITTNTNLFTPNVVSSTNLLLGAAGTPNVVTVSDTNVSVTGNVTATGNIAAVAGFTTPATVSATANITGGNLLTGGNISAVGTITATANISGGNILTLGLISSSGNIDGGNINTSGVGNIAGFVIFGNTISTANTTMYLDPLNEGTGNGTVVVLGNLDVRGTTTTINSNTVAINDLTFVVANNATTAAQADGGGFVVGPDPTHYAELTYSSAANQWYASIGMSIGGTVQTAGTINSGNNVFASNVVSAVGNVYGSNLLTGGIIRATANISSSGNILSLGYHTTGSGFAGSGTYTGPFSDGIVLDYSAPNARISTGLSTGIYFYNGGIASTLLGGFSPSGTFSVLSGITNAGSNGVGNIGSSGGYFNTVFAKATSAQYADLAEMYCADENYAPGTVVEFGGEQEVTKTTGSHTTAVAGIISTNPSYLMNSTLDCECAVEVALVGRVPCQVVGTIKKGDRLVASDIAGVATILDMSKYEPGCIIGKALEAYDSVEVGTIEVAVGRF